MKQNSLAATKVNALLLLLLLLTFIWLTRLYIKANVELLIKLLMHPIHKSYPSAS